MLPGGNSDRSSLNFAVSCYQLIDRAETPATEFAGDHVGAFQIVIYYAHQSHWFTLLCKLVVDADVVAAESSHANYSHVDEIIGQLSVLNSGCCKEFNHKNYPAQAQPYVCAFFNNAICPA